MPGYSQPRGSETYNESAVEEAGRRTATQEVGSQHRFKGGCYKGKGSTPKGQSEAGSLRREAREPASEGKRRPESIPEKRDDLAAPRLHGTCDGGSGLTDDVLSKLIDLMEEMRAARAQDPEPSLRIRPG